MTMFVQKFHVACLFTPGANRGIDSEQYNQLTRLLGLGKKDKRRGLVTQGERKLLTNLADTRTAKMPADGSKKIRPSTAHGKIQSQRVMSIFDDSQRPQTAAPSGYDDGTASRATLAPSRQERAPTARPRVNQVQQPKGARRLTVGAVDGIGHNEAAHRIQVPANQGQVMKHNSDRVPWVCKYREHWPFTIQDVNSAVTNGLFAPLLPAHF
uniref:Uncharacterized protein n=1 Tax=Branchiostoma floridae TaxID=7739 RepID=C3YRU9_BRAFL|eukprot:XP_002600842.1 hypothetical protein BRAFLDRAFT_75866 [Branchiostoma floridae]